MAGRKREPGNVGEILAMGLCVLALTAVMLSYMENVQPVSYTHLTLPTNSRV